MDKVNAAKMYLAKNLPIAISKHSYIVADLSQAQIKTIRRAAKSIGIDVHVIKLENGKSILVRLPLNLT